MLEFAKDIWRFPRVFPIFIMLTSFGAAVVLDQGSVAAPFIRALL
jgi:hypothetical protein